MSEGELVPSECEIISLKRKDVQIRADRMSAHPDWT